MGPRLCAALVVAASLLLVLLLAAVEPAGATDSQRHHYHKYLHKYLHRQHRRAGWTLVPEPADLDNPLMQAFQTIKEVCIPISKAQASPEVWSVGQQPGFWLFDGEAQTAAAAGATFSLSVYQKIDTPTVVVVQLTSACISPFHSRQEGLTAIAREALLFATSQESSIVSQERLVLCAPNKATVSLMAHYGFLPARQAEAACGVCAGESDTCLLRERKRWRATPRPRMQWEREPVTTLPVSEKEALVGRPVWGLKVDLSDIPVMPRGDEVEDDDEEGEEEEDDENELSAAELQRLGLSSRVGGGEEEKFPVVHASQEEQQQQQREEEEGAVQQRPVQKVAAPKPRAQWDRSTAPSRVRWSAHVMTPELRKTYGSTFDEMRDQECFPPSTHASDKENEAVAAAWSGFRHTEVTYYLFADAPRDGSDFGTPGASFVVSYMETLTEPHAKFAGVFWVCTAQKYRRKGALEKIMGSSLTGSGVLFDELKKHKDLDSYNYLLNDRLFLCAFTPNVEQIDLTRIYSKYDFKTLKSEAAVKYAGCSVCLPNNACMIRHKKRVLPELPESAKSRVRAGAGSGQVKSML